MTDQSTLPAWWDSVQHAITPVSGPKSSTTGKKKAGSTHTHKTKGAKHHHLVSKSVTTETQIVSTGTYTTETIKFRVTTRVYDDGAGNQYAIITKKPEVTHKKSSGSGASAASGKHSSHGKSTGSTRHTGNATTSDFGAPGHSGTTGFPATPTEAGGTSSKTYEATIDKVEAIDESGGDLATQEAAWEALFPVSTTPSTGKTHSKTTRQGAGSIGTASGSKASHSLAGHTSSTFAPPKVPELASQQASRHHGSSVRHVGGSHHPAHSKSAGAPRHKG